MSERLLPKNPEKEVPEHLAQKIIINKGGPQKAKRMRKSVAQAAEIVYDELFEVTPSCCSSFVSNQGEDDSVSESHTKSKEVPASDSEMTTE